MKLSPSAKKRLDNAVEELLSWFAENKRPFIWRSLRLTPYTIMVSEFMLQQTQASALEKHLPRFLKLFPDAKALARASQSDVLRAWQGLGYNRRALNLHRAAQALAQLKRFPETQEELMSLPGIGRYTSAAILAFSFNHNIAVVDVNIERVLSRLWKRMLTHAEALPMKEIEDLDETILPKGRSCDWHMALMDHGATICTKRNPKCTECPVFDHCASGKFFVRDPIAAKAASAAPQEKKYEGQPRRIWRGRVLKQIVDRGPIDETSIRFALDLKAKSTVPVSDILKALVDEGFVVMKRKKYQLP